ncbi:acetoacetate decarboxylase family protein [Rhodococcus triatomae]|uniref:Acetoacetate decarboxylase (ADC) n=1 Tax=Rhodococcus triatomae TaxID=300028 RepID=A0A1G8BBS7_9NOCA|nr:acetoacetate decarboxylase family protein [Rhodococcus triatomae]QNG17450.1 acetoacetate decarboxylase family protein [Rhodococcus triatomae]QNG22882.1 acetoacetate decarboxylase family protein [Rhodococcus triatomae]SDH30666.1 Acetoacetate decarboxylase (ADC) [Rhodococcus triatomae]
MSAHEVLGRTVEMPVRVRAATAFTAAYSVRADAVQESIAHTGLRALRYRSGRGICMLVFVDYIDGDLGPYNEFAVAVLVGEPGAPASVAAGIRAAATGRAGALIHHLPVDGEFTLAAGRGIWGFPKTMAEFEADHRTRTAALGADGQLIARLSVAPGLPVPGGTSTSLAAYAHLDGLTRRTTWQMRTRGLRSRPGGAALDLGEHPVADELHSWGLPRRALFTSVIPEMEMTFGDADTVR